VSGSLLEALAANGYGRVDVDELIALAQHGLSAEDIVPLHGGSLEELIDLHDRGLQAQHIRAFTELFPGISAETLGELSDHGVSVAGAAAFRTADPGLSAEDIVELTDHGVEPDFVRRLAAHGYVSIGVDELVELADAGFTP
jgi:hypothetical protein